MECTPISGKSEVLKIAEVGKWKVKLEPKLFPIHLRLTNVPVKKKISDIAYLGKIKVAVWKLKKKFCSKIGQMLQGLAVESAFDSGWWFITYASGTWSHSMTMCNFWESTARGKNSSVSFRNSYAWCHVVSNDVGTVANANTDQGRAPRTLKRPWAPKIDVSSVQQPVIYALL
jgi:hypothetical protein